MDKCSDPFLSRSLFSMSNQPWREMRATLSPLFTGNKMRFMLTFITECVNDLNAFIKIEIASNGSNTSCEYDMSGLLSRLGSDIISSTAFGIKINTFEDQNNRFYRFGTTMADAVFGLKPVFVLYFPRIAFWLRMKIFAKEHEQFFRDVIRDTVDERKKNNIIRNDMLHLLLLAKDAQDKLYEEIAKTNDELNGAPVTYECLQKMKYIDMVVSEVLRLYVLAVMDRSVNKQYLIEDYDGHKILLQPYFQCERS